MSRSDRAARLRGLLRINPARAYRERHARRARDLAARLEADDDEVVLRPWDLHLPRTVILAAARARGLEPVGGDRALANPGPWTEPMRFARPPGPRRHGTTPR